MHMPATVAAAASFSVRRQRLPASCCLTAADCLPCRQSAGGGKPTPAEKWQTLRSTQVGIPLTHHKCASTAGAGILPLPLQLPQRL